jgi:hypothetical protein
MNPIQRFQAAGLPRRAQQGSGQYCEFPKALKVSHDLCRRMWRARVYVDRKITMRDRKIRVIGFILSDENRSVFLVHKSCRYSGIGIQQQRAIFQSY